MSAEIFIIYKNGAKIGVVEGRKAVKEFMAANSLAHVFLVRDGDEAVINVTLREKRCSFSLWPSKARLAVP